MLHFEEWPAPGQGSHSAKPRCESIVCSETPCSGTIPPSGGSSLEALSPSLTMSRRRVFEQQHCCPVSRLVEVPAGPPPLKVEQYFANPKPQVSAPAQAPTPGVSFPP